MGSWRDVAGGGVPRSKPNSSPAPTQAAPKPQAAAENGSKFGSRITGAAINRVDDRLLFTAQVLIGYTVQVQVGTLLSGFC